MNERADDLKKRYAFISLLRTGDMLNRYLELQLRKHNITPSSFGLMNAILSHEKGLTPLYISEWLFRSKHAVTSLIHDLEAVGAISQKLNIQDRRSKYIILTKEGRKRVGKVMPTVKTTVENIFSSLDPEEIETFNGMLKRLRKELYRGINTHMVKKVPGESLKASRNRGFSCVPPKRHQRG
jgi:MarR family 2-MHQ and catechol resistance regulon transcriptional repressor